MHGLQAICLLIVLLLAFGCNGQFRIVGLLNERQLKNATATTLPRSNAQGRGFSVIDTTKRAAHRPSNIIRVHIIDDDNDSVFPTNTALLKHKHKLQEATLSQKANNKTGNHFSISTTVHIFARVCVCV